jgi:hypothetical protein
MPDDTAFGERDMSESVIIEGREACIQAWRDLLVSLPERGGHSVWCVDRDFAEWPLDDAAVLEALLRWGKAGARRMAHFVAADYAPVSRRFPRLVAWRRDWAHCVQAFRPFDEDKVDLPGILVVGSAGIEMLEPLRWRARRSEAAADLRRLVETSEAIAQRCEPGWPVTVLGL